MEKLARSGSGPFLHRQRHLHVLFCALLGTLLLRSVDALDVLVAPTSAPTCPFTFFDQDLVGYVAACDSRGLEGAALTACCKSLAFVLRRARAAYARTSGKLLLADSASSACIETLRSIGDSRSKFSDVWGAPSDGSTITNTYLARCNITAASLSLSNPSLRACPGVSPEGIVQPLVSRDNLTAPLAACSLAGSTGPTCEACKQAITVDLPRDACLDLQQVALVASLPDSTGEGTARCIWEQANSSFQGTCAVDYSVTNYTGVAAVCQAGPGVRCCSALTGNIALSSALHIANVQSVRIDPAGGDINGCAYKLGGVLDGYNVSKTVQDVCNLSTLVRYTDINCGNLTTPQDWFIASNNFSVLYKYCSGRGANCSSECAKQSGSNLLQLVGLKPRNQLEHCGKQFFGAWGASHILTDPIGAADALNCYFGFLNTSLELTYTAAFYAAIAPLSGGLKEGEGVDSSTGTLIGGVVGGALGLLLVVAAVGAFWLYRRKKQRDGQRPSKDFMRPFGNGGSVGSTHWFTYSQLKVATEDFAAENVIGEGGSGKVYKGKLPDGSLIAVKELQSGRSREEEFMNEASIISSIRHKYLVGLRGCCKDGPYRMLVYEYMANGSLDTHLFSKKAPGEEPKMPLDWPTRLKIGIGAAKGLHYLHEEASTKIVHRDIKASNILLDDNFNPRVSDFGLAKLTEDWQTHVSTGIAGTWGYLAPEYAASGQLTEKSDIYSFGVVLLEICSGRKPVQQDGHEDQVFLVEHAWALGESDRLLELLDSRIPETAEKYPEEFLRVAKAALLCVYTNVRVRPTMAQCIAMLTGEREVPPLPPRPQTLFSLAYDSTEFSNMSSSMYDTSERSSMSGQSQSLLDKKSKGSHTDRVVKVVKDEDGSLARSQSERLARPESGEHLV